ncbi:MAG: permease-like cell division protein FtsX [Clostridia bacterium]|nr:permease-like cell division protein FtsX [Clostridia bacterium]
MSINTISYWVAEAFASIVKNQKVFWTGVATMTIALFLIALFSILYNAADFLIAMFEESQGKIEVFQDYKTAKVDVRLNSVDDAAIADIKNKILALGEVKTIRFVSKEESELEYDSFEVTIEDYRLSKQVINKIKAIQGVAQGENDVVARTIDYDLYSKLYALDGVKEVEYISKEEAIERAKDRVPAGMTEGVPDDIYPASYIVTIEDLSMANEIAKEIRGIEGVGEEEDDVLVNEDSDFIAKLAISGKVLAVTIFIVSTVAACYMVMNSIKLMLYARRREISIMKYVGATDAFTKAPFIIEGLVIGLVSVAVVSIITFVICRGLSSIASQVAILSFLSPMVDVVPTLSTILLVLGIGIGTIGSSISINKYLEV